MTTDAATQETDEELIDRAISGVARFADRVRLRKLLGRSISATCQVELGAAEDAKQAARGWLHSYGIRTERYTASGGDHPAMDTLPTAFETYAARRSTQPPALTDGGAESVGDAVAKEREACALVADDQALVYRFGKYPDMNASRACSAVADLIRARHYAAGSTQEETGR